jgi:hypothetical protein
MDSARTAIWSAATLSAWLLLEAPAFATTVNVVPEITPTSISTGLGLLTAGVLILRARMRRK